MKTSYVAVSGGDTTTLSSSDISDEQLCSGLLDLLKRFKASMADMAEAHGLTSIQLYALHAIMQGSKTMGKVAQTLHCDASNVTGIVDRLVALELLVRQECAQDRRVKTLELTAKGMDLVHKIMAEMPVRLGCSTLQAGERVNLYDVLRKLA